MDGTPVGRLVAGLAAATAFAGGVSLTFAIVVTGLSVIGRALIPFGLSAIPGDVELVQASMLFAVFCFLPWCHLERGHAVVAIVTDKFPVRFSAFAEFIWDAVMLVAAAFIAWRFWIGLQDKLGNGESTFILRMPLWAIYSLGMFGAAIFVIVSAYCTARSAQNTLSADPYRPISGAGE